MKFEFFFIIQVQGFERMPHFYKKALLYAGITCGIYIIFPLVLFSILSDLHIIQFRSHFIVTMMVFGTIAVIISFYKNIFASDSLTHNLIGLGTAFYSGIYLFYIFGGFNTNGTFGNYSIQSENLDALLGLQNIAWLMLLAALINAGYYGLKCLEVRRRREFLLSPKLQIRIRYFFRESALIVYCVLLIFILSIILSGLRLSFQMQQKYDYAWDIGNPLFYNDDRILITAFFNVYNLGWYSIQDISLTVEIYTVNTSDPLQLVLPDNTKIGQISNVHYAEFPASQTLYNVTLPLEIIPDYVLGLIFHNASISLRISLTCYYTGISITLHTTAYTRWSNLI
jgi:hypothetical protein